jgi:hypothetical protein
VSFLVYQRIPHNKHYVNCFETNRSTKLDIKKKERMVTPFAGSEIGHPHSHSHSHSHDHGLGAHGHSHEILDGPGSFPKREMPLIEGRDWKDRAFTIGIGGYDAAAIELSFLKLYDASFTTNGFQFLLPLP